MRPVNPPQPHPSPGCASSSERDATAPQQYLSWAQVQQTHHVRNGIYHRDERIISLLTDFGRHNACYPDTTDARDDSIIYTGEGRRGDQKLTPGNRALLGAIESAHTFPLFNKLEPGRWQHMGCWRVVAAKHIYDETEDRMLWRFTLARAGVIESNDQRQKD